MVKSGFSYQDWSLEWAPGTVPGEGAHLLPIPDGSKDIALQTASFTDPTTTLRVKRSLNTGDYYDVPFHVSFIFLSATTQEMCFICLFD